MRTRAMWPLLSLTGLSLLRPAAAADQQQTSTVRGVVFDSLSMKPAIGAAVWVSGGTQIATTDSAGRFEIRGVERGKRFFEFSSPALDSLELGTLGAQIDVRTDSVGAVMLATPAFSTVWRTMCQGQTAATTDSGIVWGTLRDAATDTRLHGARTLVTWTEPQLNAERQVTMLDRSREVLSDSSGNYYVCGLPVGTSMLIQASGKQALSGIVQMSIGGRSISRLDLMVSTEMVAARPVSGSSTAAADAALLPLGKSVIRGVVRDNRQQPVAGVAITSAATDSVARSDAEGKFVLAGVRAGTQLVEARKVGVEPEQQVVAVKPGATVDVAFVLSATTELATVNVTAEAFASRDRLDYEERRRTGSGFAVDSAWIKGKNDLVSILAGLPSMTVVRNRFGNVYIETTRQSIGGLCTPLVWLDGVRSTMDAVSIIPAQDFRAVEWYPRAGAVPSQYVGLQGCAVVLFWTKLARWGERG